MNNVEYDVSRLSLSSLSLGPSSEFGSVLGAYQLLVLIDRLVPSAHSSNHDIGSTAERFVLTRHPTMALEAVTVVAVEVASADAEAIPCRCHTPLPRVTVCLLPTCMRP